MLQIKVRHVRRTRHHGLHCAAHLEVLGHLLEHSIALVHDVGEEFADPHHLLHVGLLHDFDLLCGHVLFRPTKEAMDRAHHLLHLLMVEWVLEVLTHKAAHREQARRFVYQDFVEGGVLLYDVLCVHGTVQFHQVHLSSDHQLDDLLNACIAERPHAIQERQLPMELALHLHHPIKKVYDIGFWPVLRISQLFLAILPNHREPVLQGRLGVHSRPDFVLAVGAALPAATVEPATRALDGGCGSGIVRLLCRARGEDGQAHHGFLLCTVLFPLLLFLLERFLLRLRHPSSRRCLQCADHLLDHLLDVKLGEVALFVTVIHPSCL
mmetsp:Transcript_130094/g.277928  ORF Transcript_130094/g.277928 Transcript_130094/m.277928 type:complete len:323 (+) Transcript_130094:322-1290(+)